MRKRDLRTKHVLVWIQTRSLFSDATVLGRFPSLLTHLTQRRTGTKCILPLQTLTESYYLVLSEVHSVCYYCPSLSYRAAQVCPSCDSFNHRCAHSYVGLVASLHPQYGEAERTRYSRSTACTRKNATLLESHTANK